jgi:hypothetical protein
MDAVSFLFKKAVVVHKVLAYLLHDLLYIALMAAPAWADCYRILAFAAWINSIDRS